MELLTVEKLDRDHDAYDERRRGKQVAAPRCVRNLAFPHVKVQAKSRQASVATSGQWTILP